MKKILIGTFFLSIISCNSDDESNAPEINNVIGVWKMEKTITISGTDNSTIIKEYIADECKQKSTYEFNQNGKYIVSDYNYIGQECKNSTQTTNYIYMETENKLIIGNTESKIMELTPNKLVIYVPDNYDSNEDGVDDYLKYIFKK